MTELLSKEEVMVRLREFPGWQHFQDQIVRQFELENFKKAVQFVNRIALTAEKEQHHPDILIQYNKVRIALSTHSAQGVTQKDFDLAEAIDGLAE